MSNKKKWTVIATVNIPSFAEYEVEAETRNEAILLAKGRLDWDSDIVWEEGYADDSPVFDIAEKVED